MTTEATRAHYLAAIRRLRRDWSERELWDYMNNEDYDDALGSIRDAVEYYGSPEQGRDAAADHHWADTGASCPHEWADANPRALDYWAADHANNFGGDTLTRGPDGSPAVAVLDRIRECARYSCLSATWNAAATDVERIAGEIALNGEGQA